MRGYLNLEDGTLGEIFVYPDPKFRTFNGWGDYRGWLLGDYAGPATGDEDFHFVRAMVVNFRSLGLTPAILTACIRIFAKDPQIPAG